MSVIAVIFGLLCVFVWGYAYADCSQADSLILNVPDEVADAFTELISVSGGIPPYSWSICGTGFSLEYAQTTTGDNQLHTSGIGCRSGIVAVKDSCDKETQKNVRGNTGQWVEVEGYNGDCVLGGKAEDYHDTGLDFVAIKGEYKLVQQTVGAGSHFVNGNCEDFCQECVPLMPEKKVSCFSGWEYYKSLTCKNYDKIDENCLVGPSNCCSECQPFCEPEDLSPVCKCGVGGLITYCYHHVKTLYKWDCTENPNDCNLAVEDNQGDCEK